MPLWRAAPFAKSNKLICTFFRGLEILNQIISVEESDAMEKYLAPRVLEGDWSVTNVSTHRDDCSMTHRRANFTNEAAVPNVHWDDVWT